MRRERHVPIRGPHRDEQHDETDSGGIPRHGDEQTDATGEFGKAAQRYERVGVTECRRHDREIERRAQEMQRPRRDEQQRRQDRSKDEAHRTLIMVSL